MDGCGMKAARGCCGPWDRTAPELERLNSLQALITGSSVPGRVYRVPGLVIVKSPWSMTRRVSTRVQSPSILYTDRDETFPQGAITALALVRMVEMPLLGLGITRWFAHADFVDRDDQVLQFVCCP